MSRKSLYRFASILLVVFALGHTTGVLGTDKLPPDAQTMRAAMFEKHFVFMGADSSYGGFYVGFGLTITIYLLFMAWLAWFLGGLKGENAKAVRPLAWAVLMTTFINTILAYKYFFLGPVIFSLAIAFCIAVAEWRDRKVG